MRGRVATMLLGGALVLAACGGSDDVVTGAAGRASEAARDEGRALVGSTEGLDALDCQSGMASGLTTSEAPPAPGEVRGPAAAVAGALRTKRVVPEAASAMEAMGRGLEGRWARTGGKPVPVARGLGRDRSVEVAAAVDLSEPGTPAEVVVNRDGRPVVVVSVSEMQPGYWALDQLWACSEEVDVVEYPE